MADDPRTVFVAENAALAEAVIKLLEGADIAAEVFTPPTRAETEPITGMTDLVTPDALEIRVTDPFFNRLLFVQSNEPDKA